MTSTYGNTGTTYDTVLGDQSFPAIAVPPLMALFMEAFSGITNAAIAGLPCQTDVSAIQGTIDTTQLSPALAQSVGRFQNECYSKAAAQFNNQNPDPSTYQSIANQYGGNTDLGWVGSHVYQSLYYSKMYPSSPVPGFPYSSFPYQYQQYNSQQSNIPTPQWGFPTCQQWWSDPQYGLESQLVNAVSQQQPSNPHLGNTSITSEVSNWLQKLSSGGSNVGASVTSDDAITYSLLYDKGSQSAFGNNDFSNYVEDDGLDLSNDDSDTYGWVGVEHGIESELADAGQTWHAAMSSSLQRVEIQHEVEIMQAIVLTILISVGPLLMLAGNLRMGVIFTYFFLIGSVIMIPLLEHLIHYLEMSIYGGTGTGNGLYSLTSQYVYLYNIFTTLYQFAPFVYLLVMSWCGVTAGAGVQSLVSGSNMTGKSAGVTQKIASTVVSTATKFL